jgi:zinc transporter 1/2/3
MLPLIVHIASKRQHLSPHRRRHCQAVVSLLSCFAAGVFIGICFLDLFPEVENNINRVLEVAVIKSMFPMPEFIGVVGFLLLLAVEQFVLTWKATDASRDQFSRLLVDCESLTSSYSSVTPAPLHPESTSIGFNSSDPLMAAASDDDDGVVQNNESEEIGSQTAYTDPNSHSIVRSFILLIALSLHSLFEGLAVGLQSSVDDVLRLFIALALHKCIIAFSIGLNMVQSRLGTRATVVSNMIFSFASPLGIGIGVGIVDMWNDGVASMAVIGSLQGLACGTFIYVVFFEILPHEFMKKGKRSYPDRMLKVFCLLLGFAVVVGVLFLDPQA